jgi:hypothetical protein
MPDEPHPTEPIGRIGSVRKRLTSRASSIAGGVVNAAGDVASGVAPVAGAVVGAAGDLVDEIPTVARQLAATTREAAETRRTRRRARASIRRNEPLPNLFDVHPEARLAGTRELGLQTIGVDEIVGTAVAGPAQRGKDFKPLPAFRTRNWEARWQRIKRALDRLVALPPIDALWTSEGYWVTDGHNRVAAALENGQVGIDADVRAVLLPGQPIRRPTGSLAAALAESGQVEAAGSGKLSRGSTLGRTIHDHDITRAVPDAEPARAERPPEGDREPPS